ncbi:ribosomal protein S18-alanine N-acetyltransferase [Neiella marina]|uniref:Ribosomal protein S18-alanine N-acetyltransferase n=1 Tax=Neiella holothuriorum TaxID=2870530 RepID=A0ABS7EF42_9GAMM|nr:ribosomal protein S18-alanine N-acetyltransferase [Neiella holothuriorum]MBW8190538.1 ribosomal protein S18-alanine N-acetyltransferase [Neiella holothuriorum]
MEPTQRLAPASMIIRPMQSSDVQAVAAIEQQLQYNPWSEYLFADSLSVNRYFCFVMLSEQSAEELAGYYVAEAIAGEASLHNIGIASAFQGQGFGKQLLQHMLAQCRLSSVSKVFLEVRDTNGKAINLYKSLGFQLDGVRKGYYSAPWGREDGHLMSLALS